MTSIAVTYPYTTEELAALAERGVSLTVCTAEDRSKGKVAQKCKGAEIVITILTDQVNAAFFDAVGDQLKLIAQNNIGFNNIDLAEAERRGIQVVTVPGGTTANALAEHSMALLLAVVRQIPQAERFLHSGKFTGWDPSLFTGVELRGKSLGIVGAGHSGSNFARIAHFGLGMKVLYTDLHRNPSIEQGVGALYLSKEQLLKQADVISLHVPLTTQTKHLIGKAELAAMKPSAYLLNVSRGAVIDEKALVEALQGATIAGAALDVFECEPSLTEGLAALSNVVLTPHIASATHDARRRMIECTVRSIIMFLDGQPLLNRISQS
jgi:glyoxylate reductase